MLLEGTSVCLGHCLARPSVALSRAVVPQCSSCHMCRGSIRGNDVEGCWGSLLVATRQGWARSSAQAAQRPAGVLQFSPGQSWATAEGPGTSRSLVNALSFQGRGLANTSRCLLPRVGQQEQGQLAAVASGVAAPLEGRGPGRRGSASGAGRPGGVGLGHTISSFKTDTQPSLQRGVHRAAPTKQRQTESWKLPAKAPGGSGEPLCMTGPHGGPAAPWAWSGSRACASACPLCRCPLRARPSRPLPRSPGGPPAGCGPRPLPPLGLVGARHPRLLPPTPGLLSSTRCRALCHPGLPHRPHPSSVWTSGHDGRARGVAGGRCRPLRAAGMWVRTWTWVSELMAFPGTR